MALFIVQTGRKLNYKLPFVRNPDSGFPIIRKTFSCGTGILLTIGIPNSTDKHWNPVLGIRNPRRGIQNPRLSGIPSHGETKKTAKNETALRCIACFMPFLLRHCRLKQELSKVNAYIWYIDPTLKDPDYLQNTATGLL